MSDDVSGYAGIGGMSENQDANPGLADLRDAVADGTFEPNHDVYLAAFDAFAARLEATEAALREMVGAVIGSDCYKHLPDATLKRARAALAALDKDEYVPRGPDPQTVDPEVMAALDKETQG